MEINKKNKQEKSQKEKDQDGIALALTFLIASLFLYLFPTYFKIEFITLSISILFAIIGVFGLGIEINRLSSNPNGIGLDNLGIGVGIFAIWIIFFYYFNIWWVNILIFPVLIFGIYGTILGIMNIIFSLFSDPKESMKVKLSVKLPVVIAQLAGFALTLMQILQILKIIE